MKLNMLKSKIIFLLIVGISLSGTGTQAMELEESEQNHLDLKNALALKKGSIIDKLFNKEQRKNLVSPLLNAGIAGFGGRYLKDIAQSLLPQITPKPLVNALIPPLIEYGGYVLGAYFVFNGYGGNYNDLMKSQFLQKVVTNASKFAPLALCHPQVAQLAADCCKNLASSYVSESTLEALNKYTVPAVIAAGVLGTAYLNRNILFNGDSWNNIDEVCKDPKRKVKKIYKELRPYLFIAPFASAYKADAIKNYVMLYAPLKAGSYLHSDLNRFLKPTIYYVSIGVAGYLVLTETIGLATLGDWKRKFKKLSPDIKEIKDECAELTKGIKAAQSRAEELKKGIQAEKVELECFKKQIAENTQKNDNLATKILTNQTVSMNDLNTLRQNYDLIDRQLQKMNASAGQLKTELDQLKNEFEDYLIQLKRSIEEQDKEFLKAIEQEKKKFQEQIFELEVALKYKAKQKEEMEERLKIIGELYDQGLTRLQNSNQKLDEVLQVLNINVPSLDFDSEKK